MTSALLSIFGTATSGLLAIAPTITGPWRLLMLLPLSLCISIVYKTLHCRSLRDIPLSSFRLWATIVAGMMSIGVALLIGFYVFM